MKANILSARISTCMKSRAIIAPRQEVSDDPAPRRPCRCRRISRFLPSFRSTSTICVVSANRAGAVSVLRVLCGNKEGAA